MRSRFNWASLSRQRAPPGPEEASAGTKPSYTPTGPLVADSGFRPDANGFAFANYGNVGPPTNITNLTPADMRRAFGDAVCANMAGGTCNLTPPAQQWMDGENSGMAGGHCYGFSVATPPRLSPSVPVYSGLPSSVRRPLTFIDSGFFAPKRSRMIFA